MTAQSHSNSMTKTAWMQMLREGGRWKPQELGQIIDPIGRINVSALLNRLVVSGLVHRFPIEGTVHFSYGVTKDCRIPSGVTLTELTGAGAVPTMEHTA